MARTSLFAFLDEDVGDAVATERHEELHLVAVRRPSLRDDEAEGIGLPAVEGVSKDGNGAGGGDLNGQQP